MGLTKRSSAIHAASGLHLELGGRVGNLDVPTGDRVDFFPIVDPYQRVTVGFRIALVIQESTEFVNGFDRTITATDPVIMDIGYWILVVDIGCGYWLLVVVG